MAIPIALALAGAGLASSLINKIGQPRRPTFNPQPLDENDPELALRKRQALRANQIDVMRTQDELNRAGLGGSSASFGVLGEANNRGARSIEDIYSSIGAQRRMEALDIYKMDIGNYYDNERASDSSQLSGLEGIGGLIGQAGVKQAVLAGPSSPYAAENFIGPPDPSAILSSVAPEDSYDTQNTNTIDPDMFNPANTDPRYRYLRPRYSKLGYGGRMAYLNG
jgi:hypothetical protein